MGPPGKEKKTKELYDVVLQEPCILPVGHNPGAPVVVCTGRLGLGGRDGGAGRVQGVSE